MGPMGPMCPMGPMDLTSPQHDMNMLQDGDPYIDQHDQLQW